MFGLFMRVFMALVTITLVGAALPTQAFAQSGEQSAAADALFRQAVGLAKQKKFDQAIEKFQASYALEPARGTLQGLALAEEKAGRIASASGHYRELVDISREAHDGAREKAAKKRLEALDPRVPHLSVSVKVQRSGAEVLLDGAVLPKGALATSLPADPGKHTITARADDGSRFSSEVELKEGESKEIVVEWEAPANADVVPTATEPGSESPSATPARDQSTAKRSSSGSTLRTIGLVGGGVGLIVLGVGSYVYLSANSDIDDIASKCPGRICTDPSSVQEGNDARDRRNLGKLGLIGGAVLLGAGITLFVIGASQNDSHTSASLVLGPGSLGIVGRTP